MSLLMFIYYTEPNIVFLFNFVVQLMRLKKGLNIGKYHDANACNKLLPNLHYYYYENKNSQDHNQQSTTI